MTPATAASELTLAAAPVLDATGDETSLDWPDAEYTVSVAGAGGHWQVQHHISGAAGIADLIEAGSAMFAAEARCPRTLFSDLALSQYPNMELHFDESMTREPVFVVPGIVAVADCALSTAETAVIWRRTGVTVPIRRGMWLVRGRAVKEDLASSLLLIEIVPGLKDHEMSIGPYPDQDGNTRLRLRIPAVQEPRLGQEAFIAQAWQTALAYLPSCKAFNPESEDEPRNFFAAELEAKLSGMALWHENSDQWDPVLAATRLRGMPTPAPHEAET